ncbi:hypothetical protein CDD83_2788 [Cordyceps sp. RAO-2017]|nr:hypothetical protein CDD83_2788 [Cordyceps sp. RAO-2017]
MKLPLPLPLLALAAAVLLPGTASGPRADRAPPRVVGASVQRRYVSGGRAAARLRGRADEPIDVPLSNQKVLYSIEIEVGNPPQRMEVQLDTGSSDALLNTDRSALCTGRDNACAATGTYNANASSTSRYVNSRFNISYVDSSGAAGDFVTDDVRLLGRLVPGVQLGVAYNSSTPQSVLGIGLTSNEAGDAGARRGGDEYANLPARMADDGVIASNAYSLWLNDLGAANGSILFGGVDAARFRAPLVRLPLQPVAGRFTEFYVTLTGLAVAGNDTADGLAQAASAAFLPSSFAMGAVMLGAAAFMDWRGGLKTSRAVFCFAAAAVLGWPFAAALCAPFLLEELVLAAFSDKEARIQSALRLGRGVVAGLLLLLFDFLINLFFYKRAVVVTWNIVRYNIFSSTGGPGLYGTEPWHFYFRNLALNFNLWFVLALLALPLFLVQKLSGRGSQPGLPLRTLVFVAPFYMWLAIFTAQPHKEERFMYPVYPFLVLNGSISLHMLLSAIGSSDPNALVARVPARLRLLAVGLVLFLSLDVGLARIYGVYTAYRAPMAIYKPLWGGDEGGGAVGGPEDLVCFGKEWYRFPSSYFLPRDMHAKFVRSEFRGLLPGEFSEARTGFGFWSGTWLPTSGLNDGNREDPGKYVDLRACSLLVDTQYPDRTEPLPPAEPDYVADSETWEVVKCEPFLDAASTHVLARTLWLPDLALVPVRLRRRWGRHCLLKRRTTAN